MRAYGEGQLCPAVVTWLGVTGRAHTDSVVAT
jgi:hypothetical protein